MLVARVDEGSVSGFVKRIARVRDRVPEPCAPAVNVRDRLRRAVPDQGVCAIRIPVPDVLEGVEVDSGVDREDRGVHIGVRVVGDNAVHAVVRGVHASASGKVYLEELRRRFLDRVPNIHGAGNARQFWEEAAHRRDPVLGVGISRSDVVPVQVCGQGPRRAPGEDDLVRLRETNIVDLVQHGLQNRSSAEEEFLPLRFQRARAIARVEEAVAVRDEDVMEVGKRRVNAKVGAHPPRHVP
mmetsp:Transcript_15068/g.36910  ORF Transcript_15068/g.36910 Transcript_15068/m.36910 type:complete len:240 (-) Transcript_15068:336-1055(-)